MHLLLIDDSPDDRAIAHFELKQEFRDARFTHVGDAPTLAAVLPKVDYDLVVTDFELGWTDGLAVLRAVKALAPDCPVIMFTGSGSEEVAVEAMKAGLDDYILKAPKHRRKLPAAARLALERTEQRRASRNAAAALKASEDRFRRLFQSVEQQVGALEAIHNASLRMTADLDVRSVMRRVLDAARSLIGEAEDAHIFLYDDATDTVTFGAAWFDGGHQDRPWAIPRKTGITYTVARQGTVLVVHDMQRHAISAGTGWKGSIVSFPLKHGARVVGVMNVAYPAARDFSEAELHSLQLLGDQAAIAIENARLFAAKAKIEADLRTLNAELQVQRELAIRASRVKSDFLAVASHELRTPITAIIGFLQIVIDGMCDTPEEAQRYLDTALISSQELLKLVNDILDIATIEAGEVTLSIAPMALGQTLRQVDRLSRLMAEQKGLALEIPEVPADLLVQADPDRLRQVLINLVNNAIKFTERGRVSVSVTPVRDQVHIEVRDTGIGFSAEQRARLFKKFTQADNSAARRYGGTGLGLAISKNLVELMNGTIDLESDGPDRGSRAWITLPLAQLLPGTEPLPAAWHVLADTP
jgi:signal transduction histidine kinase/DNA-binding response OmpR family regulator